MDDVRLRALFGGNGMASSSNVMVTSNGQPSACGRTRFVPGTPGSRVNASEAVIARWGGFDSAEPLAIAQQAVFRSAPALVWPERSKSSGALCLGLGCMCAAQATRAVAASPAWQAKDRRAFC